MGKNPEIGMMEASISMISSSIVFLDQDSIVDTAIVFPDGVGETQIVAKPHTASPAVGKTGLLAPRETGDQVNGFLLCALVSASAKRIKVRAKASGLSLPMTNITRCVLQAYLLAAKNHFGPFSATVPDTAALRRM